MKNIILVDKPFVSGFLRETIVNFRFPVLRTAIAEELLTGSDINFVEESELIEAFQKTAPPSLITTSENAINWIGKHLPSSELYQKTRIFKDKVLFRQVLEGLFPDFYFQEIDANMLDKLDISSVPMPFIIKPAVGFFSLGVYKVNTPDEWPAVKQSVKNDILNIQQIYPLDVLDTARFIIEENIEGEEYACDAYYDQDGEPVILCIMHHIYGSSRDVSDRVYMISAEIIKEKLIPFTEFLRSMSTVLKLKNFPLHIEVRVDKNNILRPIEINPLRYGAWCTSADLSYMAFRFNSYEYFLEKKKPDWDHLLKGKEDKIFSIIILNNSTGLDVNDINGFDYEKLLAGFQNVLEFRQTDYRKYLIFGFLFTETSKENYGEIEAILSNDLKEFVNVIRETE